jgi:hypothetical protein
MWRRTSRWLDAQAATTGGKIARWSGFLIVLVGILPRIEDPLGTIDTGHVYFDLVSSLALVVLVGVGLMQLPLLTYALARAALARLRS